MGHVDDALSLALLVPLHGACAYLAYKRRNCFPLAQFSPSVLTFWAVAPLFLALSAVARLARPAGEELLWIPMFCEGLFFLGMSVSFITAVTAIAAAVRLQKELMAFSMLLGQQVEESARRKRERLIRRLRLLCSERFQQFVLLAGVSLAVSIYVAWGFVDSSQSFSAVGTHHASFELLLPGLFTSLFSQAAMSRLIPYIRREADMRHMRILLTCLGLAGAAASVGFFFYLLNDAAQSTFPVVYFLTGPITSLYLLVPALQTAGFDPTRGQWCPNWRGVQVAAAYEWLEQDAATALAGITADEGGRFLFLRLLQRQLAVSKLLFVDAVRKLDKGAEGDGTAARASQLVIGDTFLRQGAVLRTDMVGQLSNEQLLHALDKGDALSLLQAAAEAMWQHIACTHVPHFLSSPYFALWASSPAYAMRFVYATSSAVIDDDGDSDDDDDDDVDDSDLALLSDGDVHADASSDAYSMHV